MRLGVPLQQQRIEANSSAHEHGLAAVRSYNSRAVPNLGYIAQLCLPPSKLKQKEIGVVNKVLHIATNSLSLSLSPVSITLVT